MARTKFSDKHIYLEFHEACLLKIKSSANKKSVYSECKAFDGFLFE